MTPMLLPLVGDPISNLTKGPVAASSCFHFKVMKRERAHGHTNEPSCKSEHKEIKCFKSNACNTCEPVIHHNNNNSACGHQHGCPTSMVFLLIFFWCSRRSFSFSTALVDSLSLSRSCWYVSLCMSNSSFSFASCSCATRSDAAA